MVKKRFDKKGVIDKTIYQVIVFLLGAIGLLILFYVAAMLYGVLTGSGDKETANEIMIDIVRKIELLNDGEQNKVEIFGPENYVLMVNDGAIATCTHARVMQGNSVVKYKSRFEACFKEGDGDIVDYNLITENKCWGNFEGCFDYQNLPIDIYFYRDKGKIIFSNESITPETDNNNNDNDNDNAGDDDGGGEIEEINEEFEKILNLSRNNSGGDNNNNNNNNAGDDDESLMDLTRKYIDSFYGENNVDNDVDDSANDIVDEVEGIKEIKSEMEIILKEYFKNETQWAYSVYQKEGTQVIRIVLRIYGEDFARLFEKEEFKYEIDHSNKKFEIVLTKKIGGEE